jgi:plasmid stabilization system protein ParE
MMRVVISARVQDFLRHEKSYLQRHSTTAWKKLSDRLRQTRKLLAEFPHIGAEKPLPIPGLRRFVMGEYVLDYEIYEAEVHILNMRHGRQQDPGLEVEQDFDYEADEKA